IGLDIEFIDYKQPIESQLADANIIVNGFNNIDKSILDICPKLKLVQQSGIGVDGIDVKACTNRGIYVANVPMANAISVAEHTIFLILYLAKSIKNRPDKDGNISIKLTSNMQHYPGTEIQGKTLAIIGLGVTGIEVAKRAKAFGMTVDAITKHPFTKTEGSNKKYFVDSISGTDKLHEILANSDIVSIHTPLTNETERMIGPRELRLMKTSAYLINVARAHIVDKDALFLSLTNKEIAGAAFDVYWNEPADLNEEFLKLDNFMLTPHIAGWTTEAIDTITKIITINIERISRGQVPLTIVNQELI
ncbi:MAG: phosphoglycerate dehydrogenase, partial [Thermoproteota archaeon]|nr:phosphoglycerate dehydrogenase [Thermoproteota archaeon]